MEIDPVVTEGLGNSSYLLSEGDVAVAVDPQRDVRRLLEAAEARGTRIRAVLETHVHNDYVSGAAELRSATGATLYGPAGAGFAFGVTEVDELRPLEIGGLRLSPIRTPGHTPEHVAYLLEGDEGEPIALFSGGSLIVGTAGRTDLLGDERTDELTRAQFRSMRRLAELPDDVVLLPTHGVGSFCASAPSSQERTSSLGAERATNPALTIVDEDRFVARQLSGLPAYPAYYAHMAPINRMGPPLLGEVPLPEARSAGDVAAALADGAWLVDARDSAAFAAAHVPGSLNVPLEPSFASYVGWLVPFDAPVLLLVPDEGLREAATQLFRIGYEATTGFLRGGIDAWRAGGNDVASYPTVSVEALVAELADGRAGTVVDVRQRTEWDAGHLEGSRHLFVGDVPAALDGRVGGPGTLEPIEASGTTTVVCASGYRSAMAASLFDRSGRAVRLVPRSGVPKALKLQRSA